MKKGGLTMAMPSAQAAPPCVAPPLRAVTVVNVSLKALLLIAVVCAAANDHLPHLANKAMTERAFGYPLAALIVPLVWWSLGRRRPWRQSYPHAIDIALVFPFLYDIAANILNLYDSYHWWDDVTHFLLGGVLAAALASLLLRAHIGPSIGAALLVGLTALGATLWEIAEYLTFVPDSSEFSGAYRDTIGDLALSNGGGLLVAIAFSIIAWPRSRWCHCH